MRNVLAWAGLGVFALVTGCEEPAVTTEVGASTTTTDDDHVEDSPAGRAPLPNEVSSGIPADRDSGGAPAGGRVAGAPPGG